MKLYKKMSAATQIFNDVAWNNVSFLLDVESGSVKNAKTGIALTGIGNGYIDTAAVNMGKKSFYFPSGTAGITSSEEVLGFGLGDFCIDFFIKLAGNDTGYQYILAGGSGTSNVFIRFGDTGYSYKMHVCVGSTSTALYQTGPAKSTFTSGFRHVAVDRNNGTLRVFVDGSHIFSSANTGNITAKTLTAIGNSDATGATGNALYGWLNNLRITKYSRFTAAFDPTKLTY